MNKNIFDVIIIGAGPAGMTAALYALRARMNVLLLDKGGFGGQALIIDAIENFPSYASNSNGFDWVEQLEKQLKSLNVSIKLEKVISLKTDDLWHVKTDQNTYHAHAVIYATGAMPRSLDVPGEKSFIGKGVSYCATCDGAFFKDKRIVVVGGGDTAVKEAVFLTRFGKTLTVVHRRDRLRAEKVIQEKLLNHPTVSFEWDSVVTAITGDATVTGITVKNVKTGKERQIPCEGVFVLIGITPKTDFLKGVIELDDAGFIKTTENMETNKPGLFAAGDCRQKLLRQIITACGDGATAAFVSQHFVDAKLGNAYKDFNKEFKS